MYLRAHGRNQNSPTDRDRASARICSSRGYEMTETLPFPQRDAPPLARVRQRLSSEHVEDVRRETRGRLLSAGLREKIKPGAVVAVTAGSRGMGGFVELVAGCVDAIKECGGEPFVMPAMGSHGGATAEGQTEILRRLGITQESVGAPVRTSTISRRSPTA